MISPTALKARPWQYDTCRCGKLKQKKNKVCAECRHAPYAHIPSDTPAAAPSAPSAGAVLTESLAVSGDHAEITRPVYEAVRTLADLIRVCEIDTSEWEVERWVANKWEVGAKDKAGDLKVAPLFQVKAWMKRRRAIVDAKAEIASLLEEAKQSLSRFAPSPHNSRSAKISSAHSCSAAQVLLEPSIPDLHIGKLAWGRETGWDNYDIKIAEQTFDDALSALLARTKSFGATQVLFPVGNDLLHSDTKQGTTTGGTQLDTDSRFHKSFMIARRMITRAIDRMRDEIGPVHVVMVPGNHDTLAVWHLGDSLEMKYASTEGITIDNEPTLRKYYEHGRVMLMLTHGNRGKLDQYPLLMASEKPEMWGRTIYKEAHTGDKHHLKVQEHRGVKVRISPALCPPDAWHSEFQFVGAQRSAEAFCWDKEAGLIGTAYYTVGKSDEPREGVE